MIRQTWLRWNRREKNIARMPVKIGGDVDDIVVTNRNIFFIGVGEPNWLLLPR